MFVKQAGRLPLQLITLSIGLLAVIEEGPGQAHNRESRVSARAPAALLLRVPQSGPPPPPGRARPRERDTDAVPRKRK